MTSPLPVKVPTREQCDAALGYLRTSYESVLSMMAKEWRGEEFHRRELACNFPKAAAALGLRLSADEPKRTSAAEWAAIRAAEAQQPSDLVKRLRGLKHRRMSFYHEQFLEIVYEHLEEAADRIEALEAALEAACRDADYGLEHGDPFPPWYEPARAALAKARGEAP